MSWTDPVYWADFVEKPFEDVRRRQHGRDPWNKQRGQAEVLEREVRLKEQRQKKADRELEEDAEERKKKRVDQGLPENGVREGRLILSEAVERHFPTDECFNRGVPEAQRQTVDDRVKQEDQAENDEGQNEQVRRQRYEELPCVHRRLKARIFAQSLI